MTTQADREAQAREVLAQAYEAAGFPWAARDTRDGLTRTGPAILRAMLAFATPPAGIDDAPEHAIPVGWMLVPIEPTEAMIETAINYRSVSIEDRLKIAWADMLAAAPAAPTLSAPPPVQAGEVEKLREALSGVRAWAASLTVTDMNEIVADGGITAGMVVGQEACEQVRRIDRVLSTPVEQPIEDRIRAEEREAAIESAARAIYVFQVDNGPIHSNREPTWDELSDAAKSAYRGSARATLRQSGADKRGETA